MSNDRKQEHIKLAFDSQSKISEQDQRFIYEPMIAAHPDKTDLSISFLGKKMLAPIWVSSMTGGTGLARTINGNIAKACREFGLGMGLGSCRKILFDRGHWADFDFRNVIGDDLPFYANLGIAQVEELLEHNKYHVIIELVESLNADGLIIHVNPLQEWFQPEGNRIKRAPVDTIQEFLEKAPVKTIVKEVGQGFGHESMRRLLQLPLEAIEFGAFGGTNFSRVEMIRQQAEKVESFLPFTNVGQTAEQMVHSVNQLLSEGINPECKQLIISGGIQNSLDGYYLTSISKLPSVYGMASQVLKYTAEDYHFLAQFLEDQIQALKLAKTYLKINPDYAQ